MTRLVGNMGGVWRLSEVSYARLLRKISLREPWDLDSMGVYLGDIDKYVTDLTPHEAQHELESIKSESHSELRARRNLRTIG